LTVIPIRMAGAAMIRAMILAGFRGPWNANGRNHDHGLRAV